METNKPRKLTKPIGKSDTINDQRPQGVPPVPPNLIAKYGDKIGSVWWHAKGRGEDPTIGVEIDGIRKTFGGYTWNDWWYFMKTVHEAENDEDMPQCYWYRKRKIPDPDNPNHFEIVEEYVGERLEDPDTGYDLEIPPEIKHDPESLCN